MQHPVLVLVIVFSLLFELDRITVNWNEYTSNWIEIYVTKESYFFIDTHS